MVDLFADEAKRLRRVVRALGMDKEVPEDDASLRECLFSVLGLIARKLEASAQPNRGAALVADAPQYENVMDHNGRIIGVRMTNADKMPSYAAPSTASQPVAPSLTVWYGPMPESNGKSNFTATLKRKGASFFDTDSYTFALSEYPDRVRYEADCMRYLIGEIPKRPDILDYDADKHSGYIAPSAVAPSDAKGKADAANAAVRPLKERDPTKPASQQGLYHKFHISRVDGSDVYGGKHFGCRYFVLDMTHDQHAPAALRAYAASCATTHPELSADLRAEFGQSATSAADAKDAVGLPRTPTEVMLNAARDWSVKKYGLGVGNDDATGCWQVMYDAAMAAAPSSEIGGA